MGDVTSQITRIRDADGVYRATLVRNSFEDFEPSDTCISYRKSINDAVYSISEEYIDAGGEGIWSVDVSTSTEPIETHQYFSSIPELEKRNWSLWKRDPKHPQLQPAGWDPLMSEYEGIQTLYYWWQRDVTTYLAPRIVARWTVVENHPPLVSGVGQIASGWHTPLTDVPSDVNFLLGSATGRQQGYRTGNVQWFLNTYELLGSARSQQGQLPGQFGWLPFLYARTGP
jgi:hypothetical protein